MDSVKWRRGDTAARDIRRLLNVIVCVLLLAACAPTAPVQLVQTHTVVERVVDTVVQVKVEREVVIVETPDTCAVAETKYAEATARVEKGRLNLHLRNKDTEIPTKIQYITKEIRDSIPYPVEVEKEVRYVAWYDKAARALSLIVILTLVIVFGVKIWSRGLL